MTQLAPVHQEAPIPLGRRIGEIMEEKGDAYSLRALGKRIGMSKDVLHRCIHGERYIKNSELEKIAAALQVPVARLKQEDVERERGELQRLLKSVGNPKRALELAQRLLEVAMGVSERCYALNNLGRAYYDLRQYDAAHEAWLKAYPLATVLSAKYQDSELLLHIISNVFLSFSIRKDYSAMGEIKSKAISLLDTDPERSGRICYSLAKIAEHLGNLEEAKSYYYKSIAYYDQTEDVLSLASVKHNTASFEFRRGQYKKSKELFEDALGTFETFSFERIMCLKEYSKTLIRRGELAEAEFQLQHALQLLTSFDSDEATNLKAKVHILLSRTSNTPHYASQVSQEEKVDKSIRRVACRFLIQYYEKMNVPKMVVVWQKLLFRLLDTEYDVLHEEDL